MATAALDDTEKKETKHEFDAVVNMSASQLKSWLETDESKSVGQKQGDNSESTGHQSGKRIIDILGKKKEDHQDIRAMLMSSITLGDAE